MKSKKFLYISAFMLVGLLILIQIEQKKQSPSNEVTKAIESDSQNTHISVAPTISLSPQTWNLYKDTNFSFQFPPEWHAETFPIKNEGVIVTVRPNILPTGIIYPQFILQTQKSSEVALQNKIGFLEGFGMKRSETKVGKASAIKYRGTVPFKTTGNQTIREPIQDVTVLLNQSDTLYVFKYEYEGSEVNKDLDDFFNDFIASFKTTN